MEITLKPVGEQVIVVSHKATIRLLLSLLLGFDPRRYRDNLEGTGSVAYSTFVAANDTTAERTPMVYAGAIWAFSLLQIVNRAYYALHDTRTPLVHSSVAVASNHADSAAFVAE